MLTLLICTVSRLMLTLLKNDNISKPIITTLLTSQWDYDVYVKDVIVMIGGLHVNFDVFTSLPLKVPSRPFWDPKQRKKKKKKKFRGTQYER